ncbi:MAG: class I SAM-dependent methyltransferase [Nanoarchaeota archaeon]|nr:class I SAM-dependent methyltransferase [Nanoarchaeota archaeon]
MLRENADRIMKIIGKKDLVLDVGGWAIPFNRANYVIDIHPYETRGFLGSQGGTTEYFTKKTWVIHDVSSRKKLPFKDKQFDFVICSNILEDIRDPVWLCSELIRVAKMGYIEIPSIEAELTKGIANNKYAGYYHHRWLVAIKGGSISFRFKPHLIHTDWRFHLPRRYLRNLKEKERISYLFWNRKFGYEELIQISRDKIESWLYNLIKTKKAYPSFYYLFDNYYRALKKRCRLFKKHLFPKSYFHKYMNTEEYRSK